MKVLEKIIKGDKDKFFKVTANYTLQPEGDSYYLPLSIEDSENGKVHNIKVYIASLDANGRAWSKAPDDIKMFIFECGLIIIENRLKAGIKESYSFHLNLVINNVPKARHEYETPEEIKSILKQMQFF